MLKQPHVRDTSHNIDQSMTIDNLLSGKAGRQWAVKVNSREKLTSNGKLNQLVAAKSLAEQVDHYDLLSSLAHANAGISIRQLFRGDFKEAAVLERKSF